MLWLAVINFKLNIMTYNEFIQSFYSDILPNKKEYIREGQCLMNYLADIWFNEYNRLSSIDYYDETNIDCFYKDNLIPNTLKHLEKEWINYPN